MSLVVENGTGLATAESFISVADASARQAALGNTNWATIMSNEEMEQALRRATVHMEQAYRARWKGQRATLTQALSWPRYDVCVDGFYIASDSVPLDIAHACADLAFKAASGDLAPDLTRGVVREKVGPIETEYDRASPQATRFRSIDMTLAPYLKGSGMNAGLIRA